MAKDLPKERPVKPSNYHGLGSGVATGRSSAGFHGFTQGAFEVTVLSDGFITLPADIILPDAEPSQRRTILKRLGGDEVGAPLQTNIPLIRHGNDLILVDTGSGANFQPSDGKLADNLTMCGINPSSVTKVIFTHVHPDHSGGTTRSDGSILFPNAHYYVGRNEWSFWNDPEYQTKMPDALHAFARGAQRDLAAVAERLTLLDAGDEVVPGMNVVATRGHTPGHISLELAGDETLLITGDAITNDVVFFENPSWHFGFDTEPEIALKTRRDLLDRVATEKTLMLGYHWSYPGVGYADRNGSAYRFVPG
jgi:glyoxylase-like metal-dependent hydrolase (beta-lactamase superfamily II)